MAKNELNIVPPQAASTHLAIVQLTRAGDLVQTLQAASEIKKEKPQIQLTLVARKHYSDSLKFLLETVFDNIVTIDTPKLFSSNLDNAFSELSQTLNLISKTPIDALVNLSFCKPSQYLCGLIKANHKLGPWIGSDNQDYISDKWSQLLYSTVTQGPLNPFHLVDLFKLIIGVKTKKDSNAQQMTPRKPVIVVHPFASTDRKRWKPHKWSEILYSISKNHEDHTIYVVGAPNESQLAQEIFSGQLIKTRKNIVNSVGKTKLKDVFERLTEARLFIGHDSLIGHLASLAKTKTMTLALGSVRPWETAPYGANNLVLSPRAKCFPCFPTEKCAQYICHSDIPYQVVTNFAGLMLKDKDLKLEIEKSTSPFLTGSCRIFLTEFHKKSNLIDLCEIDIKSGNTADILRPLYRMTWALLLGELEENREFPLLTKEAHGKLLSVMDGIKYVYELSEFGKKYSLSIVEEVAKDSPSLSKIKANSQKIDEIDKLLSLVKNSHPSLAPVIDYYNIARANLPGGNVVEIAQNSFFVYQDSALATSILNELIGKTLAEYKINLNQNSNTVSR
ncbi:MAG: hypothetical protein COV38_02255 [Bdellovibrionales bacterium CG11_big_fil_rev_8_21_14_0_20_38_13]|nr:MAG: hypothetical protein COW79_04635 [Bdellovibrionales bacterium CG22_combo_CG10-13_8_21_14_all_38_13]PIR31067.1 MAG: hypothetical protein COV38_02255 [Bdellovibrionales bacterium CG11_big_fil_rev_8_21_14_0_20_38_13]